jgi:hypothetical protein
MLPERQARHAVQPVPYQDRITADQETMGQGPAPPRLEWISKPMHAPFDWADRDALDAALAAEDDREKLAKAAREAGAARDSGPDAKEDAGDG